MDSLDKCVVRSSVHLALTVISSDYIYDRAHNLSSADLEKCITFFNAMYSVLLANDNLTNEVQLIRDYTASITSACDAISTDSASMQALLQVRTTSA